MATKTDKKTRGKKAAAPAQNGGENGYVPRLKELYDSELRAQLKDELEVSSIMQVPRITKITLNMGVGDAKTDAKVMDAAIE